ncbi:MAG: ABC transporter substrate-binding protein [Candidatus Omnitrophica bacterium]|nr:ABC transporter substrate-binding protein [Candidatus Omnitrophota bacterium]
MVVKKGAGLLVGAVALLGLVVSVPAAKAQEKTIPVGVTCALSGTYQELAEDMVRAYKLAAEEVNASGGLLGKNVEVTVKDTQTKADIAANLGREFYDAGVSVVFGGPSSGESVALQKVAAEKKKLFFAGLANSDAVTGFEKNPKTGETYQAVTRHSFRWNSNSTMVARTVTQLLQKQFGKTAKYYFLVTDYSWGWSMENALRTALEKDGGQTLGASMVPLGEKSFVPHLLKARAAKPDVLVVIEFGSDMVNAIKQANSMGIHREMKIAVPLMEMSMARSIGAEFMQGVMTAEVWVWQLMDRYPGSKDFVEKYKARYDRYPGSAAATAWVNLLQWADAVKRANTLDAGPVVRALEGHKFTLLKGEEEWREWDHQCLTSSVLMEGKAPAEMANEWDLFKILDEVPGTLTAASREENPVVWKDEL